MKKRPIPRIEQLEAREVPDVSLGHAAPCFASPGPARIDVLAHSPVTYSPPAGNPALADAGMAIPKPAGEAQDVPALQALESLFFSPEEVEKLVARPASPGPSAEPAGDAAQGWQFLCNYTRKAIRNEELRYGPLPDHEDLLQQTFVEWRQTTGPGEHALANLLDRDSAERLALRKAVRRVIDHVRYDVRRQRRMVEITDQPIPSNPADQDWIDLRLDLGAGVGKLGPRERQTLELRRQGKTFDEIGAELGLLRQRAFEIYHTALGRLQEIYGS
jgi:DNA-directed RNA polymerase specialized sigma24 family protein